MGAKKLAEAIILQSIEDLYDVRHRTGSVDFFTGESFHTCARMAGLGTGEKLKVLNLVREVVGATTSGGRKATGLENPSTEKGVTISSGVAEKAREAAFHR